MSNFRFSLFEGSGYLRRRAGAGVGVVERAEMAPKWGGAMFPSQFCQRLILSLSPARKQRMCPRMMLSKTFASHFLKRWYQPVSVAPFFEDLRHLQVPPPGSRVSIVRGVSDQTVEVTQCPLRV